MQIEFGPPAFRRPWVGRNYSGLLLVGESHHGTVEEAGEPNFTIEVVESYASGAWNHRYFTGIGRLLTGLQSWELDRRRIWDAVAFHNYVPALMDGPGEMPTEQQFQAGADGFLNVLDELRPTHILVLCDRLWWRLPPGEPADPIQTVWGVWETRWYRSGTSGRARAMRTHHPSRFSSNEWRPLVATFLDDASRALLPLNKTQG